MKTYFEFDGKIYEQEKGTPMGSPISGFIAEAVMQKLESISLPKFNHKLWVRYVDKVFTIVKKTDITTIYETLNNVFEGIQLTVEKGGRSFAPFPERCGTQNTKLSIGNVRLEETNSHRSDSALQ